MQSVIIQINTSFRDVVKCELEMEWKVMLEVGVISDEQKLQTNLLQRHANFVSTQGQVAHRMCKQYGGRSFAATFFLHPRAHWTHFESIQLV